MKKDMKEALGNNRKPDTTHVRNATEVYIARACEYGNAKGYERSNFLRSVGDTSDDFQRLRAYVRAAKNHLSVLLDDMEKHQSGDYHLVDTEGMKIACYSADTDYAPGSFASGLPHIAHAVASLNMAISQAVLYGLLPADPGQPWETPDCDTRDPQNEKIDCQCRNPDCEYCWS